VTTLTTVEAERRGSRWLHSMPSEDDVREWFDGQPLHEGMSHAPYTSGIVVINATEKFKVTKRKQNGDTFVSEQEQSVYTPYVKVDTRIAYFWDYVRVLNGGSLKGDFIGVIEKVAVPLVEEPKSAYFNAHLPAGFFMLPVKNKDDSVSRYIGCTMRVAIYERESFVDGKATLPPLLAGEGTKQTPLARNWADDNAIMKAETGATGRALGMAGILVIGTGVATAEDVQEALAGPTGAAGASSPGGPEAAVLPPETGAADVGEGITPDQTLEEREEAQRTKVRGIIKGLAEYPDARQAYNEWWQMRGFGGLEKLTGSDLQAAVIRGERLLEEARTPGRDAPLDPVGEPPEIT
jgi:hypothetical protein